MVSSVGLATTLESGHFNGYPLNYEIGPMTHGSFEWPERPPQAIFDELRAMGTYGPENVMVQVNHPRDSILGYFGQYERDPLTAEFVAPGLLDQFLSASGPAFFRAHLRWGSEEGGDEPQEDTCAAACARAMQCYLVGDAEACGAECLEDSTQAQAQCVSEADCSTVVEGCGLALANTATETTFSTDFEAIELLNGKRLENLHHYRVPEVLPEGEMPEDIPPAGTILVDEDGEVAFPGQIDDWYNWLNLGYRFIGVGTSDSHYDGEEPGYARTLIYTGEDEPAAQNELDLIRAMRTRRVITTNGPLIDFYINDASSGAMGQTLTDEDGNVSMTLLLTAAPWVSVGRINIVRNGLIAHVIEVDETRDLTAEPVVETIELALATNEDGDAIDSWFVVEVIGYRSFFPVVRPLELPPLTLTDAIGSLAGAFGLDDATLGDLQPALAFPMSAYAITNPVWVTLDGELTPPGQILTAIRTAADQDSGQDQNPFGRTFVPGPVAEGEAVRFIGAATPIRGEPVFAFERDPGNPYDIRRLFEAFSHRH
jgi:hypothetical protein